MRIVSFLMLLGFLCLAGSTQAQADAISKYFGKYVDDDRFSVIYISPKMFQLFDKMNVQLDEDESEAVMSVVKDLRGLRILAADEGAAGLYQEAINTINTTEYELLMTVRNKAEDDVQFLIKDEGDIINELLMIVGSADNFVLMSFVGNIDLAKVSELSQSFEEND